MSLLQRVEQAQRRVETPDGGAPTPHPPAAGGRPQPGPGRRPARTPCASVRVALVDEVSSASHSLFESTGRGRPSLQGRGHRRPGHRRQGVHRSPGSSGSASSRSSSARSPASDRWSRCWPTRPSPRSWSTARATSTSSAPARSSGSTASSCPTSTSCGSSTGSSPRSAGASTSRARASTRACPMARA